jgi:hypothetical protein
VNLDTGGGGGGWGGEGVGVFCVVNRFSIVLNHLPWKVAVGVKYNSKSKTRQS